MSETALPAPAADDSNALDGTVLVCSGVGVRADSRTFGGGGGVNHHVSGLVGSSIESARPGASVESSVGATNTLGLISAHVESG